MKWLHRILIHHFINHLPKEIIDDYRQFYGREIYDDMSGFTYRVAKNLVRKLMTTASRHQITDREIRRQINELECSLEECNEHQNVFSPVLKCHGKISLIGFKRYFSHIVLAKIYNNDELKIIYKYYTVLFSLQPYITSPFVTVEFINFDTIIKTEIERRKITERKKQQSLHSQEYLNECISILNDINSTKKE